MKYQGGVGGIKYQNIFLLLLEIAWNTQIYTEKSWMGLHTLWVEWGVASYVKKMCFARNKWNVCMKESCIQPHTCIRGASQVPFKMFLLGIAWNIQIYTEKSCMEPQPLGWRGDCIHFKKYLLLGINEMSITAQNIMSPIPMPYWVGDWGQLQIFSWKLLEISRSVQKKSCWKPSNPGGWMGLRSIKKRSQLPGMKWNV